MNDSHDIPSTKRDEPIRIFKSDFMEFFTHINPIVVLIIWVPIIALALIAAGLSWASPVFPWHIPFGFVFGIIVWSFSEYALHRFLFHYHPKSERGKRINFMFHGVHHAQPMVKTRLVMPPLVSIPLAAIFYGVFYLVFAVIAGIGWWVLPLFAGTAFGYVCYDMTHYAIHHFNIKSGIFKWIRSHHMMHHVKTPNARFGVTSPLWDEVFHTEPEEPAKKVEA